MISMERSFLLLSSYKKELYALACSAMGLLVCISLYSFDPYDPSPFFLSSSVQITHNWCGFVGAYLASMLFFICGTAAYAAVLLGAVCAYWLCVDGKWKQHWERVVAGTVFILIFAALCTIHRIGFISVGAYGGYFGFFITSQLYRLFDTVGSLLVIYTSLYMSLVVLVRFSFIASIHYIIEKMRSVASLCRRYRVGTYLYNGLYRIGFGIAYVMRIVLNIVRWLIFRAAGSRAPEEPKEPLAPYQFAQQPVVPVAPAKQASMSFDKPNDVIETNSQSNPFEPIAQEDEQPTEDFSRTYGLPDLNIFIGIKEKKEDEIYRKALEQRAHILEQKLEHFGVYGHVVSIKNGPIVTLFEYQPNIDTKISKILALEDDLALALQAHSIRILAPIPGRSVVGFEVSNQERKEVLFAHVIQSSEYEQFSGHLPLILGKDTVGNDVVVDLTKMPHLLIAGSTGSGKSVALNVMLMSLLCKCKPDDLRLILIDPKRLEFAPYADVAHLLFPIITEPKRSIPVLRWVVQQMDHRYEEMAAHGVRNIFDYNTIARERGLQEYPFIVVVIDELSDLMLTVGREIEDLITRIAQMARAAGIHMIVATQRPSVDVITGLIKVNFPSRISFRVTSKVDSRTILDCGGADKLLGRGDMLFLDSTASTLKRIHGAYVSDEQITMVTSHIRSQRRVEYLDLSQESSCLDSDLSSEDEELLDQVVLFLGEVEEVSISLIQRKFRVGYNRSARIIDMLESRGLIMPADGSRTRRVIR